MEVHITHLLATLLFAFLQYETVMSFPCRHDAPWRDRIPLDIDISGPPPNRVKISASLEFPGGLRYTIQSNARHTHRIGDVMDLGYILLHGDSTNTSRNVLAVPREDDSMYVRIISVTRALTGGSISSVKEFIKKKGNLAYFEVQREMIELDIKAQEDDERIYTKLLMDHTHPVDLEGIPEDLEILPVNYVVKPELRLKWSIGVVRFGHYIVDDDVEGLLYREVTWYGGIEDPNIKVVSHYKTGVQIERVYYLRKKKGKGFVLRSTKRRSLTLRDE